MNPTIVLVHGAFAESASWNGVADRLRASGHPVVAAANPLRDLAGDAATVADLVRTLDGPVVLVGHSYGGAVISNVPADAGDIAALVFVAAFAPGPGESCLDLSTQMPGSTLAEALRPIPRSDGSVDLAIAPHRFHSQFCADVPAHIAQLMSMTQRPISQGALAEVSGPVALWQQVPSSFVVAGADRNIPPTAQRWMAARAGARHVLDLAGASHAVAVSHPSETAQVIREAAALRVPA